MRPLLRMIEWLRRSEIQFQIFSQRLRTSKHSIFFNVVRKYTSKEKWTWKKMLNCKFSTQILLSILTSICSICRRWVFLVLVSRLLASSSCVFICVLSLYRTENCDWRHLYSVVSTMTDSGSMDSWIIYNIFYCLLERRTKKTILERKLNQFKKGISHLLNNIFKKNSIIMK